MDNPFSWDYLTTVPGTDEVFGPFAIAYLIVFGVGFLGSIYLYNDGASRYLDHPVKRRAIRRGATFATIVFGVGLFFFGIRVLQINPFNFGMRIWLWLSALAAVVLFAFFAYYLRTRYPAQLKTYEERRLKQQYLRPVAATAVANGRPVPTRAARPVKRRRR
jgi:4-hydroxybenzoate polyprenyltransferase